MRARLSRRAVPGLALAGLALAQVALALHLILILDLVARGCSTGALAATAASTTTTPTRKPTTRAPTTPPPTPPRVRVPKDATFFNAAWGIQAPSAGSLATLAAGRLVVIVDLDYTSAGTIQSLKAAGHIVQCYFSVGTAEMFRDDVKANRAAWVAASVGAMADWPDERWLDLRKLDALKTLQGPRFERAKTKGCDALELDNTDCFDNGDCWKKMRGVTKAKAKQLQIAFNTWQVTRAHELGLAVSLKNTLALVPAMAALYDFAVNEQCVFYNECAVYRAFTDADKAVFNHEYRAVNKCAVTAALGIRSARCAPTASGDECKSTASWVFCDAPVTPLPPITRV